MYYWRSTNGEFPETAEKESNSFYEGDNFKPCLTKNSFKHV